MHIDEQIDLAAEIAKSLPEVTRNDWTRWSGLARRYGVGRAIGLAEHIAQDSTMRPAVQRAHRLIATAMKGCGKRLSSLTTEEQEAVLGYVGQFLAIKTLRGSLRR